jgi:hypothetical protein
LKPQPRQQAPRPPQVTPQAQPQTQYDPLDLAAYEAAAPTLPNYVPTSMYHPAQTSRRFGGSLREAGVFYRRRKRLIGLLLLLAAPPLLCVLAIFAGAIAVGAYSAQYASLNSGLDGFSFGCSKHLSRNTLKIVESARLASARLADTDVAADEIELFAGVEAEFGPFDGIAGPRLDEKLAATLAAGHVDDGDVFLVAMLLGVLSRGDEVHRRGFEFADVILHGGSVLNLFGDRLGADAHDPRTEPGEAAATEKAEDAKHAQHDPDDLHAGAALRGRRRTVGLIGLLLIRIVGHGGFLQQW